MGPHVLRAAQDLGTGGGHQDPDQRRRPLQLRAGGGPPGEPGHSARGCHQNPAPAQLRPPYHRGRPRDLQRAGSRRIHNWPRAEVNAEDTDGCPGLDCLRTDDQICRPQMML